MLTLTRRVDEESIFKCGDEEFALIVTDDVPQGMLVYRDELVEER